MILATYQDGQKQGQQITLPAPAQFIHAFETVMGVKEPIKVRYVMGQRYFGSKTLGHIYDLYYDGPVKSKKTGPKKSKKAQGGYIPVGFTNQGYVVSVDPDGQHANVITAGTIKSGQLDQALLQQMNYFSMEKPSKFIKVADVPAQEKNPSYEEIQQSQLYAMFAQPKIGKTYASGGYMGPPKPVYTLDYTTEFGPQNGWALQLELKMTWKCGGTVKKINKIDLDNAKDPVQLISQAILWMEEQYTTLTGQKFPVASSTDFLSKLQSESNLSQYFTKSASYYASKNAAPVKVSEAIEDIGVAAEVAAEKTSELTGKYKTFADQMNNYTVTYKINSPQPNDLLNMIYGTNAGSNFNKYLKYTQGLENK